MKPRTIATRNLRRRKGKSAFLILGLTLGVTTVVTLMSVTRGMRDDISNTLDELGANIIITPRSDDLVLSYGGMTFGGVALDAKALKESDEPMIRAIGARASLNVVSPKLIGVIETDGVRVPLMGVRFDDERRLKRWWKIQGQAPTGAGQVLLGSEVAVRLLKRSGDDVTVKGGRVRVAGVLEETGSQDDFLVFGDLAFVQGILNRPGGLSLIEVAAFCSTCPIEEIVGQISENLPEAKVTAIKQTLRMRTETLDRFRNFSTGLSVIVLLIGGLIVFTHVTASVNERRREIGIFRAIGFRRSHIVRIILVEAVILGLVAGTLGYLLGLGLARVAGPLLTGVGPGKLGADPLLGLGAIFLSVSIGILSSLQPAVRASKMDPLTALRSL